MITSAAETSTTHSMAAELDMTRWMAGMVTTN